MFCRKVTLRVLKKIATSELQESSYTVDAQLGGYTPELASLVPKGESAKMFNPGQCTQLSKSSKLAFPTGDAKIVGKEILRLYTFFKIAPTDLRGAGISLDDLETPSKSSKITIHSFFQPSTPKISETEQAQGEQTKIQPSTLNPNDKGLKRTYAAITPNPSERKPEGKQTSPPAFPASKKVSPPPLTKGTKKQTTITSMFSKAVN